MNNFKISTRLAVMVSLMWATLLVVGLWGLGSLARTKDGSQTDQEIDKLWAQHKATRLTEKEAKLARSFETHRTEYNERFLKP